MQKVTLVERQAAWDKMIAMMAEWMQDDGEDAHRPDDDDGRQEPDVAA